MVRLDNNELNLEYLLILGKYLRAYLEERKRQEPPVWPPFFDVGHRDVMAIP